MERCQEPFTKAGRKRSTGEGGGGRRCSGAVNPVTRIAPLLLTNKDALYDVTSFTYDTLEQLPTITDPLSRTPTPTTI